jgi:hypothetical protein
MRHLFRAILAVAVLSVLTTAAPAQDGKVTYRDRGSKGVQAAAGKIESESVAGIRVGGKTVSSADIVDVQYELPASVRLDYNSAASTEATKPAEAIKGYEALAKTPQVQNNRLVKRHLEYKVAVLTAAQADEGPAQLRTAIVSLEKFRKDHPDAWQLVPVTRTLGRLHLDREPPEFEAARQAYDDLARANGVPADVRQELTLLAIDVLTQAGKLAEAQQRLASLPAGDPRVQLYQVGLRATPANLAETVKQLEDAIERTADPSLKAAAYNVLGDCYRRDPKHKKDALYAYLWVDVIYNQDPIEVNRAVARLASLFAELKDDERAKKYRDRLRGK